MLGADKVRTNLVLVLIVSAHDEWCQVIVCVLWCCVYMSMCVVIGH